MDKGLEENKKGFVLARRVVRRDDEIWPNRILN
jgi:hypothetical protein